MSQSLFYFFSFVALLSALMVVFSRNAVYSVLYLILVFVSLSGHYFLLNAQFLAIVNIIVYAGAIMVLFLFTVMFLNLREDNEKKLPALFLWGGLLSGGALLVLMLLSLLDTPLYQDVSVPSQIGLVENLGKVLYKDYLIPFELASVLFLSAMVGAVLLGKNEKGERQF